MSSSVKTLSRAEVISRLAGLSDKQKKFLRKTIHKKLEYSGLIPEENRAYEVFCAALDKIKTLKGGNIDDEMTKYCYIVEFDRMIGAFPISQGDVLELVSKEELFEELSKTSSYNALKEALLMPNFYKKF